MNKTGVGKGKIDTFQFSLVLFDPFVWPTYQQTIGLPRAFLGMATLSFGTLVQRTTPHAILGVLIGLRPPHWARDAIPAVVFVLA